MHFGRHVAQFWQPFDSHWLSLGSLLVWFPMFLYLVCTELGTMQNIAPPPIKYKLWNCKYCPTRRMLHDAIILVALYYIFQFPYKSQTLIKKTCFFNICSPEGNFDIDAGDGVGGGLVGGWGGGPFRTPKIHKHLNKLKKHSSYKNCSHFWDIFPNNLNKSQNISLKYVPIYRKYKEHDKHIQNISL